MPSKRPSPSAIDAGAAPVSPFPPASKKRSSRPNPRTDDGHPEPNPSSRGSPAVASRRKGERERKRKRRPGASTDSHALAAIAASGGGSHGAGQRLWTDADEVALLTGAASFCARTGHVPRLPDMGALYDSIRGVLSPHLDQAKVYYKLKRFKSKFLHAAPATAAATQHDRLVRDLCNSVWGSYSVPSAEGDAEAVEGYANELRTLPDAAAMLPVVTELLHGHWKTKGRALSGVALEKGLSLLGTEEGRSIEAKWRRQLDAEMRTQMRRHDLAKEVYALLIDAIKGLGP